MSGASSAWLALPILAALACEGRFGHGPRDVVAWVGDEPIRRAELQAYLSDNLLPVDDTGATGDIDPVVASRLLDALIEQRLLLAEALRVGIEVTDVEVAIALGEAEDEPGHSPPSPTDEVRARERLMIEKLQERELGTLAAPTDDQVSAWASTERERLLPERPVELRALQLPTLDVARSVRAELRKRRVSFEEAIVAHEPSPGQTVSSRVSWDELPPEVRSAIDDLGVGDVSEPVDLDGRVFLFEILSRPQDPQDLEAELLALARKDLEARRDQEALAALVRELRGRTDVQIRRSSLPFPYSP